MTTVGWILAFMLMASMIVGPVIMWKVCSSQKTRDIPHDPDVAKMRKVCQMVLDVRAVIMFNHVHADFAAKEVLDKYGVQNVQELAEKAYAIAAEALGEKI